jgi:hypothetical protein
VGLENSGDIRSDGVCQDHSTLPAGPVLKKTLREVLAFDDTVDLLSVGPSVFKQVMEHSVAAFVDGTKAVNNTPSGQFLQAAGVRVTVDCTLPPESSTDGGARVTHIDLVSLAPDGGEQVDRTVYDSASNPQYPTPDSIRIASNSFIISGGSGFSMLTGLDPGQSKPANVPGLTFQIASRWFQKTYAGTPAAPALGAKGSVTHRPVGGWTLSNCR